MVLFLKYLPSYILPNSFPYISLLTIAAFAFVFSLLFRMGEVINGILAMRILLQFIGQAIGVVLLRKRNGTAHLPFKMPLYPLPVVLAVIIWAAMFYATGLDVIQFFAAVFISGLLVFLGSARYNKSWPFNK